MRIGTRAATRHKGALLEALGQPTESLFSGRDTRVRDRSASRPGLADEAMNEAASLTSRATATGKGALASAENGLHWLLGEAKQGFTAFSHGVQGLVYGVSFKPFQTRVVTDDPSDANHPDSEDLQQAQQETQAYAAAETAAVAMLSPGDQKKYAALVALFGPTATNPTGFPLARRALQQMLLAGTLTGQKDLAGGNRLLDNLSILATEPLASGIDRATIVSQTAIEVQNPARIDQQAKGTCVATTGGIVLARLHPSEYVRLIAGLASPSGQVKMAGGDTLTRVSDWNDDNDGDRTISQRLLAPALMNAGQFPLFHYDNSTDHDKIGPIPLGGGLMASGSAHINSELEGHPYDAHTVFFFDRSADWNEVKRALAAGKGPIPVGVMWSDSDGNVGGHELQVDKVENGTVSYLNPWGQYETMSEAEFEKHLTDAEIPA